MWFVLFSVRKGSSTVVALFTSCSTRRSKVFVGHCYVCLECSVCRCLGIEQVWVCECGTRKKSTKDLAHVGGSTINRHSYFFNKRVKQYYITFAHFLVDLCVCVYVCGFVYRKCSFSSRDFTVFLTPSLGNEWQDIDGCFCWRPVVAHSNFMLKCSWHSQLALWLPLKNQEKQFHRRFETRNKTSYWTRSKQDSFDTNKVLSFQWPLIDTMHT